MTPTIMKTSFARLSVVASLVGGESFLSKNKNHFHDTDYFYAYYNSNINSIRLGFF